MWSPGDQFCLFFSFGFRHGTSPGAKGQARVEGGLAAWVGLYGPSCIRWLPWGPWSSSAVALDVSGCASRWRWTSREHCKGDPSSWNKSIASAVNSCFEEKEMRKWTSEFSFIFLSKGYNSFFSNNSLELSMFFVVCLRSLFFFFLTYLAGVFMYHHCPKWESTQY